MKKFVSALFASILLWIAAGCSTEDIHEKNDYAVSFSIKIGNDTAGEMPEDNELLTDNVTVWMFDTEGNFIDMLKPEQCMEKYGIDTETEGLYDLYISANADIPTGKIKNLEDWKNIQIAGPLSANGKLPMVSENPKRVELQKDRDLYLGEITLVRLAARIEVLNYTEGLNITSVTIKNVATCGNLSGTGSDIKDITLENTDIMPETVMATHVYSFPFHPQNAEQNLTAEITYSIGEETETLYCDFGNSEPLSLYNNSIYSIIIRTEDQTPETRTVSSWSSGTISDNVIEVPKTQEEKNRALLVSRFAETDVMTIDNENMTVAFCKENNSKDYGEEDAALFWSWAPEYADNTYTGDDGHKYKVPDSDEMTLLCPQEQTVTFSSEKEYLGVSEPIPDLLGISGSGGNGKSDFRSVKRGSPEDNMPYHTCYAIRFRNTKQTAAYRYKWEKFADEIDDAHISVRIKACDNDLPLDIVCEESWWNEGYIEYIIPAHGYGGGTAVEPIDIRQRGKYSYYWTSENIDGKINVVSLTSSRFDHNKNELSTKAYNLRMIRID